MRIFKTRTQAGDACNGGKVRLNGQPVKAAKTIHTGDELQFKKGVLNCTIQVLDFPKSRLAAKEVWKYYLDKTPDTELLKLKDMKYVPLVTREKGTGRPTKKERRTMDDFQEPDAGEL